MELPAASMALSRNRRPSPVACCSSISRPGRCPVSDAISLTIYGTMGARRRARNDGRGTRSPVVETSLAEAERKGLDEHHRCGGEMVNHRGLETCSIQYGYGQLSCNIQSRQRPPRRPGARPAEWAEEIAGRSPRIAAGTEAHRPSGFQVRTRLPQRYRMARGSATPFVPQGGPQPHRGRD